MPLIIRPLKQSLPGQYKLKKEQIMTFTNAFREGQDFRYGNDGFRKAQVINSYVRLFILGQCIFDLPSKATD